ncbi:hypothetical protein EV359DRAFT_88113 [Lentinula novae-zelandiae]|nr:hypothetical protein EV359DRAFT_88113 [Lentinula novae-zelandiae]
MLALRHSHIARVLVLSPICAFPEIGNSSFCADPPMIATVPIVIPRWTHEIVKIQMDASDLITALDSSDIERREVLALKRDAGKTRKSLNAISLKYAGALEQIHALTFYGARSIGFANIFGLSLSKPANRVLRFLEAMAVISQSIDGLNAQAGVLLEDLEELEIHISLLHVLNHQVMLGVSSTKSEIQSKVWTTLGGNKFEVELVDKQLALLEKLAEYRKNSRDIAAYAFLTLQHIRDVTEDLSLRASDPMLAEGKLPVQIASMAIPSTGIIITLFTQIYIS